MAVVLARVDNRLIHGQVLESWIPKTDASAIIVADDSVVDDALRQSIMEIALPEDITCSFVRVLDIKPQLDNGGIENKRIMILFSHIKDALDAINTDIGIKELNIGNIHYEKGKRRFNNSISLSEQEISWLREIEEKVHVDIRATPRDGAVSLGELLNYTGKSGAGDRDGGSWIRKLGRKIFSP